MRCLQIATIGLVFLALIAPASFAAEYTVVIEQMKFGLVPAGVHAGDIIVWQNKDFLRHTATARDRSFDVDLPPGTEHRMPVSRTGSFPFFCKFHPGMTGTLVVSP